MSETTVEKRALACVKCGYEPSIEDFLKVCDTYWADLDTVVHCCPDCGERSEIQILKGAVVYGYTYSAGSVHFVPMEICDVPGLAASREEDGLRIEYRGSVVFVKQKTD